MALRAAFYCAALAIGVASRRSKGKAAMTGPQVEGQRALFAVVVELQGAARCALEVAVLGDKVGRNLDTMSATWDTGRRIVKDVAKTPEDEAATNATALEERLQKKAQAAEKQLEQVHLATLQARAAENTLTATAALGKEYIRTLASFVSTNAGTGTKTCLSSTDFDGEGSSAGSGTKWSKWGDAGIDDYLTKVCPDLFGAATEEEATNKACEHARKLTDWPGKGRILRTHAGGSNGAQGTTYKVEHIGEAAKGEDGKECPMLMADAVGKYGLAITTKDTKVHFAKLFELTFSSSTNGFLALDAQAKINEAGTKNAAELAAQIVKEKERVEASHTKQKCTSRGRTKTCQALDDAKGETQDTV
ncbi:hypothetical protein, conserved in T. vivax, partial [Trypanosoma vivax Y486]